MFIPDEDYRKILKVMPILCVDCLIVHENKCLLLRRTNEPEKGHYWFPGGRVFKGEVIRNTALRKAFDEVNLDCRYDKIISIEETIFKKEGEMECDIHTVNICCGLFARNINGLTVDKYHDSYIWVDLDQVKKLDLHLSVFTPLVKYLEQIS